MHRKGLVFAGGILDINAHNLCRHVPPGSIIEITGAYRSSLGSVIRAGWGKLFVRPERRMPEDGRVLIRLPLENTLLQATARLSSDPTAAQRGISVVLDTFTNISCRDRRTSVRLTEPVPVRLESDSGVELDLVAVNMGVQGILLAWPDRPAVALGERLRLGIRLDGRDIVAMGDVVRVSSEQTAVRFTQMAPDEQAYITNCAFRRECDVRRRERRGSRPSED